MHPAGNDGKLLTSSRLKSATRKASRGNMTTVSRPRNLFAFAPLDFTKPSVNRRCVFVQRGVARLRMVKS